MDYLSLYEPIVDMLADFLGEDVEVVLHDLSDLEQSIYKIRNGHISGRKVGDPITNLVAKSLATDKSVDYECNYVGLSKDNKKLKCATFYIRNAEKQIVGAMCINMMVEQFVNAKRFIDSLLSGYPTFSEENQIDEHLGVSIPEMVDIRIEKVLEAYPVPIEDLSKEDKITIVTELNNEGIFLLKGTVGKVAHSLNISEPTVYKYLQQLK
ncbi:PAS domain-containing protein [Vibrio vulnificus]|uniref:helix-turn-helix transcriptional regulator n=1 Tax=Vibrio vulnificus TaxID=672 RepID=UPI0009285FF6|nr:PAS domain-containing protein [Vibrio vulnificus]MCA3899306.1 PAS domain-containing protein [Vibrio vulnificus]OJI25756.1 YheO-like PAS domain protein [Vibrio vulnificus]HAS8486319.1 DNA-binding protein [Vibrio vulnificus]